MVAVVTKPGNQAGDDVDLTLTGGMVAPVGDPWLARQLKDGRTIGVGGGPNKPVIQVNFAPAEPCVGFQPVKAARLPRPGEFAALVADVTAGNQMQSTFFEIGILKTGLVVGGSTTSRDHKLIIKVEGSLQATHGNTTILMGGNFRKQVAFQNVEWVSTDPDVFVFTGPVVAYAGTAAAGSENSAHIHCPGANRVTATLTR